MLGPAVSVSGLRLLRRLLGPAAWWAPLTGLVQSRQASPAAGGSGWWLLTVVVLLMTRAWSPQCGYSPAAWREITVATPGLIWLMVHWPRGKDWLPAGGRPPSGPAGLASAVFRALANRQGPPSSGRTDKRSWEQGFA